MIPAKLFIYWTMILAVVIGCPIIISIYLTNIYLVVMAMIIPMITTPIALTYIGWQIKRYLNSLGGHKIAGL